MAATMAATMAAATTGAVGAAASRSRPAAVSPSSTGSWLQGRRVAPQQPVWRSSRCRVRPLPSSLGRRQRTLCAASFSASGPGAGAGGEEDPYKVLGTFASATSDQVTSAYRFKLYSARGNEDETKKIEEAYSRILMRQFSMRASGQAKVDKQILYADKKSLVPWRPRVLVSNRNDMAVNGAISGGMILWALFSPLAKYQPMVFGAIGFLVRMNSKLAVFNPSPTDRDEAKMADWKRLLRSMALVLSALISGIVLATAVPSLVAMATGGTLPWWLLDYQSAIVNIVVAVLLWLTGSYLR
eukprot:jgi/Chlat1/6546/Chrsp45S06018